VLAAVAALAVTAPARASDTQYIVGAGDTLKVSVYGETALSGDLVVPTACKIEVALIGAVDACERTPSAIEDEVRARLGERYLIDPRVIVEVSTYGSQKVDVGGAVKTPGIQILRGPTPLTEVVAAAGGPEDASVMDVELIRAGGERSTHALADLHAAREPLLVHRGDTVTLRHGRQVYLDGEVKREGPVPYRKGLTLTQAITLAGGPSPFASRRRATVLTAKGERIVVNLNAVRKGTAQDRVLEPDDRITLPRSWF
jgi:polysaccharide export outer membrane protein